MPLEIRSADGNKLLARLPDQHGVMAAIPDEYGGGQIIFWYNSSPTSASHHPAIHTPLDARVFLPDGTPATLSFPKGSVSVQRVNT